MKKSVLTVTAIAMTLAFGTTVFAATPAYYHSYIDANGDGYCDNHGDSCNYADADRDGICDYYGTCNNSNRPYSGYGGNCKNDGNMSGGGHGHGRNHH